MFIGRKEPEATRLEIFSSLPNPRRAEGQHGGEKEHIREKRGRLRNGECLIF